MPIFREPLPAGPLEMMAEEEIKYQSEASQMYVGTKSEGSGRLILTTARVVFQTAERQVTVDYPSIVLHAVSRDPKAWKEPCLYCQLRTDNEESPISAVDSEGSPTVGDADDEDPFAASELRFVVKERENLQGGKGPVVPASTNSTLTNRDALQQLFDTMSEMIALHPDPDQEEDSDSEVDEENMEAGGWVFADGFDPSSLGLTGGAKNILGEEDMMQMNAAAPNADAMEDAPEDDPMEG
ncbi:unnamed protein product [Amoebophrya sp. A25]|nr:unnamed protein product [Amoebophrya sp. A25]|eukprot:GSA25T00019357001.1